MCIVGLGMRGLTTIRPVMKVGCEQGVEGRKEGIYSLRKSNAKFVSHAAHVIAIAILFPSHIAILRSVDELRVG